MTNRDLADLVLLGAIWGASFLLMRVAVPEFGPIPLIAARVGIGAAFLFAVLARRGHVHRLYADVRPLAILGAVNSAIPFTLFAFAVVSVTAGFAAVLNSTAPLFGAIVAFVWLRDRPAWTRVLGLAIGFAGVAILVRGRASVAGDGGTLAVAAGLFAAFLYGIAANYTKKRLSGVDPLVIATGSLIAATLLMIPVALVFLPRTMPSLTGWISAIALGIFCNGCGLHPLLPPAAQRGPIQGSGRHLSDSRVWRVVGYTILREPLTSNMIAGCLVILVGIALTTGAVSR